MHFLQNYISTVNSKNGFCQHIVTAKFGSYQMEWNGILKKLVMVRLNHFALGCVAKVLLRRNIRVN